MNDPLDRIVKELQGDIPIESRPYLVVAQRLGISEKAVIDKIKEMQDQGKLRRIAAVLRHQKAGYKDNAMVVWKVPENQCDETAIIMADHDNVSHCYWRETPKDWPYTIFTMIHARNPEELQRIVNELSNATGINDYQVIESIKELKKTSVTFR